MLADGQKWIPREKCSTRRGSAPRNRDGKGNESCARKRTTETTRGKILFSTRNVTCAIDDPVGCFFFFFFRFFKF